MLMRQLGLSMTVVIGCLFVASLLVAEDGGKRDVGTTTSASATTSQASQPATASQSAGGSVTGKVVRRDGSAVANAKVKLLDSRGQTLATAQSDASDAKGLFVLRDAPTGNGYFIQASDPGRPGLGQKVGVSVQAGQATDIGSIVIFPPEMIN
jgi:hypothetical protein